MQNNAGLLSAGAVGAATLTPADISIRLSEQAAARHAEFAQQIQQIPMGSSAAGLFQRQFQAGMQSMQSQQFNPYIAQAMAGSGPGTMSYGDDSMMPSPLMVTPASTGVFRPRMSHLQRTASLPPINPLPIMSGISPFTVQRPQPLFRTASELSYNEADLNSIRRYSYAAQVPGMAAQSLTLGAGAAVGAGLGRRFGALGTAVGAGIGMAATYASGVSNAAGVVGDAIMQPSVQRNIMGAALQQSSTNWVVSGNDLHARGIGLNRDASINLAKNYQDMANDKVFRSQTNNTINAHDLTKMTGLAGSAGLLDSAQSVKQISDKVKETAKNVTAFMAITEDPDIKHVILKMGQMRQLGMTQQDMVSAARGMKTYARMAGTTIAGIQQLGGQPGAMMFNQAGLTAASGFNYGNYSAASARQYAATSGVSPQELALMGGISGITQRDIQAQAAMATMPLYGMSNAQFGGGQWQLNKAKVGSASGGAFGMVTGAITAANKGVREGGLGALALMPLQQKEISDKAMREMSPEDAMLQRFSMVKNTAESMGLEGTEGFGAAAQMMFGEEVGGQMWRQAKNPQFWVAQKKRIQRQREDLAVKQAAKRREARGLATKVGSFVGLESAGKDIDQGIEVLGDAMTVRDPFRAITGSISDVWGENYGQAFNSVADFFVDDNIIRRRTPRSSALNSEAERKGQLNYIAKGAAYARYKPTLEKGLDAGLGLSDLPNLGRAKGLLEDGYTGAAAFGGGVFDAAASLALSQGKVFLPSGMGGTTLAQGAQGAYAALLDGSSASRKTITKADEIRNKTLQLLQTTNSGGEEDEDKLMQVLSKVTGGKSVGKLAAGFGKGGAAAMVKAGRTSMLSSLWNTGSLGGSLKEITMDEIKTYMFNSNPEIAKGWDKLAKNDQDFLLKKYSGKMADADSDVADKFRDTKLKFGKEVAENEEKATQATSEAYAKQREKGMKALGLEKGTYTSNKGVVMGLLDRDFWTGDQTFWDKDGLEEVMQSLGGNQSVEQSMLLAAVAGGGESGTDKYDEAYKEWLVLNPGGSEKEFNKEWRKAKKAYKSLDRDQQDIYKGMTAKGGTIKQVASQAVSIKDEKRTETMRTYAATLSDYADPEKMTKLTHRVGSITGKDIANAMSDEGLARLAETEGGDKKVNTYIRAQGVGPDAEKAQRQIEEWATRTQDIGTKSDKEGVDADGDNAEKLKTTEGVIDSMAVMVKDFSPAVKDFKKAAKDFKEAMEADAFADRED